MLPWKIMTPDRFTQNWGVCWHTSSTLEQYQEIAKQFGIELDSDFNISGNHLRKDYAVG
jgi:hypothetical protein